MPFCEYLNDSSTVRDVMGHQAARYAPLENFTHDLMRGDSPFSVAERELIAAFVSGLNACKFCYGAHVAGAEAFGTTPGLVDSLVKSIDGTAALDARMKPVLQFVRKLTVEPAQVTQADANAVYAAGWGEDALHDAAAICALFSFYNRLVDGHGVKGDAAMFPMIGDMLKQHGYAPKPTG
jgi:uncharacterized peroxidase-related enzyme